MAEVRVLSVGQCGLDQSSISRFVRTLFPARVEPADTHDAAVSALAAGRYDLVLVNRICDADGTRGVELIRALKSNPQTCSVPVMLISNHASAQMEAVELGALPGFGKAELGSDNARRAIRQAVSSEA
jgi:two-component system chemotaxis response regulator CheY